MKAGVGVDDSSRCAGIIVEDSVSPRGCRKFDVEVLANCDTHRCIAAAAAQFDVVLLGTIDHS